MSFLQLITSHTGLLSAGMNWGHLEDSLSS